MNLEFLSIVLGSNLLVAVATALLARPKDRADAQSTIIKSEMAYIKQLEERVEKLEEIIQLVKGELDECIKARDGFERRLAAIENGGNQTC